MDYEVRTYETARFHVPEGMYSIEQLEQLLSDFKEAKRRMDQNLAASLKPKTFMATYEHQAYGYWTDESGQTHLGVIPKEKS